MSASKSSRKIDQAPHKEQIREARREDRGSVDKEEELDEALRDSFPASDPVALTQPTAATPSLRSEAGAGSADKAREKILKKHSRVNLSDDSEIEYWTERFGVSEDELRKAVREAGFIPADVADRLGKTL
jgi:DNA polymerase III delta prime subunit